MCAQSWRLGGLTLQVREGDLFEVPAMAIVSSEQTNFVLSWEESAISGQIRERLDPSIQTELDEQTCGKVLPAGTVLVTHGGPLFEQIYHAGFHEPWVWLETDRDDALETDRDDAEAEHVRTIRQCIRIILQRLKQDSVTSVAFPLLGCGLFGLDPRLLAYEFTREVADFAQFDPRSDDTEILLVLRDNTILSEVLDGIVQALIDRTMWRPRTPAFELGVEYLDLFEKTTLTVAHPAYRTWMLLRYAELATGFLLFKLASEVVPPAPFPGRQALQPDAAS